MKRMPRGRIAPVLTAALAAGVLAGCSGGGAKDGGHDVTTLTLKPAQCVVPPTEVKAELATVHVVACSVPHTQEVYATPTYTMGATDATAAFPGADPLKTFAQGACAQAFQAYVGTDYQDSSLFFTYLLPSPRSWQDAGDRTVVCIISTTGQKLTTSVKDSKL